MKRLKISFFALALVMAMVSAFAFSTKPADAKKTGTVYYYTGPNSLPGVKEKTNWIENDDPCNVSGTIPCSLTFNGGDRAAFNAHILTYTAVSDATMECDTKRSQ